MEPRSVFLIVASLLVLATSILAETDEEYWARKAAEAYKKNIKSYVKDPFSVTNSFNAAVHKALDKKNTTRRSLQGYKGQCKATNPIDRCWRCREDWAKDRQRLSTCAKGFGRKAYGGGRRGEIYVVTDSSDNDLENPKPGTLRYAVIQDRPLWIVFQQDMTIRLQQELMVTSNKTIDGRGSNVHIAYGSGITVQFVANIIIHGLHIHNCVEGRGGTIRDSTTHMGHRTKSDGDGVSIYSSSNVWVDHLTMSKCADGLVDVIEGSTAVTISNNYFTNHNDVMLFGSNDEQANDTYMQVTLAFNHFGEGLVQRIPRARYGFIHVVNNDYTEWESYAIGGTKHPTFVCQGNRFTAPNIPGAKEVTKREFVTLDEKGHELEKVWRLWNWTSEKDLYRNGAFFRSTGMHRAVDFTKNYSRFDVFKAKPGSYVRRLTRYAGALACKAGEPC